jgi:hypothetical protein
LPIGRPGLSCPKGHLIDVNYLPDGFILPSNPLPPQIAVQFLCFAIAGETMETGSNASGK